MFYVILGLITILVLFCYSCCAISSKCSREEEQWQRQEYGKLKKG